MKYDLAAICLTMTGILTLCLIVGIWIFEYIFV